MSQNAVMVKLVRLLGIFNPRLGKIVCGKMSGRLFGLVTTKMFQPKQNLLRYKFSRAKNKKRGMVKRVNKIAILVLIGRTLIKRKLNYAEEH